MSLPPYSKRLSKSNVHISTFQTLLSPSMEVLILPYVFTTWHFLLIKKNTYKQKKLRKFNQTADIFLESVLYNPVDVRVWEKTDT